METHRPCNYPVERTPGLVVVVFFVGGEIAAAHGFVVGGGDGDDGDDASDNDDPGLAGAVVVAGTVVGPTVYCASWTTFRRSGACCE